MKRPASGDPPAPGRCRGYDGFGPELVNFLMAIATLFDETGPSRLRRTVAAATYLLLLTGGIACLWLAVILDDLAVRIVVAIVGTALLTIVTLMGIGFIKERNKQRWLARPISQDGVVELIQAGTVNRFVQTDIHDMWPRHGRSSTEADGSPSSTTTIGSGARRLSPGPR